MKQEKIERQEKPLFLKSVVRPVEKRLEMASLPKMCKNCFYGS